MTQSDKGAIHILHSDALKYIFSFLHIKDIKAARAVCREWNQEATDILVVKSAIKNEQYAFEHIQKDVLTQPQVQIVFNLANEKNIYNKFSSSALIPLDIFLYSRIIKDHKALISRECPVSSPVDHLLSLAYEKGDMESVRSAINIGADIHIFDNLHFKSTLDYENQKPFIKILVYLISLGAQINIVDQNQILDLAFKAGDRDMIFDMINLGAIFQEDELELFAGRDYYKSLPLEDDAGYFSSGASYIEDEDTASIDTDMGPELMGEVV